VTSAKYYKKFISLEFLAANNTSLFINHLRLTCQTCRQVPVCHRPIS